MKTDFRMMSLEIKYHYVWCPETAEIEEEIQFVLFKEAIRPADLLMRNIFRFYA